MGGRMSKQKGMRGEYEVRDILQPVVDRVYRKFGLVSPQLKRNLEQTRSGGADLNGLDWMALEVKYREQLQLNQWWKQTKDQARPGQLPVLVHRANFEAWKVRTMGYLDCGGGKRVACPVDITLEAFLVMVEVRTAQELKAKGAVEVASA